MKPIKYLFLLGIYILCPSILSPALSNQIRSAAQKLQDTPNQLNVIPTNLKVMFNMVKDKIPEVSQGLDKIAKATQDIKTVKTTVENNKEAPEAIKNKIISALSKLESTLPRIQEVFSNLKKKLTYLVDNQNHKLLPIENDINQAKSILNGEGRGASLSSRLQGLADLIAKGEKIEHDFEDFGQKTKKGFEDFGNSFKKAFHIP